MNKLLLYVSAIFFWLLLGACQKEVADAGSQGDANVIFTVEVPEVFDTKAMSKAESTDILYYEVWNSDWTIQVYPVEEPGVQSAYATAKVKDRMASLELKLVSNQTYNFIFWAQNADCGAYNVDELTSVKIDYDVIGANGNQDRFDVFYALESITVNGRINETVLLKRPFAQLNFAADVMDTTIGDIVLNDNTFVVSQLASVFNTRTGYGESPVENVAFSASGLATTSEDLLTNGKAYTWVTMDYMLMMNEQSLVNVDTSFDIDGMPDPVVHNITNVPLKKNYRTNIVGDLFTTDASLEIVLDPRFDGDLVNMPGARYEIAYDGVHRHTFTAFADALAMAKDGDTIVLKQDVMETLVVDGKKVTVDLAGHIVRGGLFAESDGKMIEGDSDSYGFWVRNGGELTIKGNGKVKPRACTYSIGVWAQGGTVTIEDGWFENAGEGSDLIYASAGGHIYIYNGEFKACEKRADVAGTNEKHSALNLKGDGTGSTISVFGGRFYKFNPSDNQSENPAVDFAQGRTVEKDGDWYVVY